MNNYLGNTTANSDQKAQFLRAMPEWVQEWQTERNSYC